MFEVNGGLHEQGIPAGTGDFIKQHGYFHGGESKVLVQRVERIWLKPDKHLGSYGHVAKNLYNETNYIARQWFIKHGKWLRYTALNWLLKDVKQSENYNFLPAQTAQQTLKLLEKNWKSFFASIKDWKKNPHRYLDRPKLPKYLKKDGEHLLLFTNQQVKLKDSYIHFPRKTGLRLKTSLPDSTNLSGARVIPKGTGYVVEIIYKKDVPRLNVQGNRIGGIDTGLDNLVTIVSNTGAQPVVIDGKKIKALNQWFNKRLAELKSIYDRAGVNKDIYRTSDRNESMTGSTRFPTGSSSGARRTTSTR